ncbi:hypothetical protein GCM10027203_32800 [Nonomuraea fastidiosa]
MRPIPFHASERYRLSYAPIPAGQTSHNTPRHRRAAQIDAPEHHALRTTPPNTTPYARRPEHHAPHTAERPPSPIGGGSNVTRRAPLDTAPETIPAPSEGRNATRRAPCALLRGPPSAAGHHRTAGDRCVNYGERSGSPTRITAPSPRGFPKERRAPKRRERSEPAAGARSAEAGGVVARPRPRAAENGRPAAHAHEHSRTARRGRVGAAGPPAPAHRPPEHEPSRTNNGETERRARA